MVKVLDCVFKREAACASLNKGRDMRDMPSIGSIAINVLSRILGVKRVIDVRKVVAMCCVVLWCKGDFQAGDETGRVRFAWSGVSHQFLQRRDIMLVVKRIATYPSWQ